MELALSLILLAVTAALLLGAKRHSPKTAWLLSGVLLVYAAGRLQTWQPTIDPLQGLLPPPPTNSSFETSDTCRKCHPDQYASWHDSFHRTMTQRASPEAILGDFDDVRLEMRGRSYRLQKEGTDHWVEMNDPGWEMRFPGGPLPAEIPRVRERVILTTGSHHMQVYWTDRPESNGMLFQFPWVYSIDQKRWIPAHDSFLRPPPGSQIEIDVWNSTCIACHAVGGEPYNNLQERSMYSRVAEFGIACEACHGPAREHLLEQNQPWRRYANHWSDQEDSSIVNPERLSPERSSQVCGRCHSTSVELDEAVWSGQGYRYLPGQDLEETQFVLRYAEHPTDPRMVAWLSQDPNGLRDRFWPDGTMRVAGREFNAIIESACYQQGELSCLSCHSMHEGDPKDQLNPQSPGDQSCLNCHRQFEGEALTDHTNHAPDSSGSQCMNCHMPNTTYGLFGAMRSHRIDNPSVDVSTLYGRPNACNLCHLDQTLEWTGQHMSQWYGQPNPTLNSEQRETAASLLWLLKGDAVQRAISAWHLGWKPALEASGRHWQAPLLAQLLDDPYSVVRFISGQSISRQSGFEDFEFDFIASPQERRSQIQVVLDRWKNLTWPIGSEAPGALLLSKPGAIDQRRMLELIRTRDRQPIRIVE